MILYVNGDSNSAAAEAVNPHGFAEDDPEYQHLGRQPHPDNLAVSYGQVLANRLGADLECDAESASSNNRIIRTTTKRVMFNVNDVDPDLIVIGWSTWEREEWWHTATGRHWQVNAGGVGHDWPDDIKDRYRHYIANLDYDKCVRQAHDRIYELHLDLQLMQIPHVFFNCFEPFTDVKPADWGHSYLAPYDANFTFYNWLKARGHETVYPGSYHYGAAAHADWAELLYGYVIQNLLTH